MSIGDQPLRPLIKQLIKETMDEIAVINSQTPNQRGVVSAVNDDGTVNVVTANGAYTGCGTPIVRVIGEQVTVITADGQQVAI